MLSPFQIHILTIDRAYIAASRRSDRSLDARIESARRASEIHEQRTGRPLSVTKEDVLNEEMYEEVIPLPTSHWHSVPSMQTGDADFDRKFLAYLGSHLATRGAHSQAVAPYWQGDLTTHDHQTPFANPSLPPTPFSQDVGQQPKQTAWSIDAQRNTMRPSKFRHTPYPLAIPNPDTSHYPQADLQAFQGPDFTQQYINSPCDSPLQVVPLEERLMSSTAGSNTSSPLTSTGTSPTLPRLQSSDTLSTHSSNATPDNRYYHHRNPGTPRGSSPTIGYPSQPSASQALTAPLSTRLPADCQGLFMQDPPEAIPEFASPWGRSFDPGSQRYSYSYNPNGRPEIASHSPTDLTSWTNL